MPDKNDTLERKYDDIVRALVPRLTAENVELALGHVNALLYLQEPDFTTVDKPDTLLGKTSDGRQVVYKGCGTFGRYYATTAYELRVRVVGMNERALAEIREAGTDPFCLQIGNGHLQHATSLLEELIALGAN